MSDNATAPAEETPAQEVDWKAEARKWEARAKANTAAAKRVSELEEALSTAQADHEAALAAVTAERDQLAGELGSVRLESTLYSIANQFGIDPELVDLIKGADEDEMRAKAEKLASVAAAKKAAESADGQESSPAVGPYVPGEGQGPNAAISDGDGGFDSNTARSILLGE